MSNDGAAEKEMSRILLEIENLEINFNGRKAVKDVSLKINTGEVLAVVGESGSGKTVTALSIMRLIENPGEISGGKIIFRDEDESIDLLKLSEKELENISGNRISMIFQDPLTSLNPVLSIGYQISETLRVHRGLSKVSAKQKAIELLETVGINQPNDRYNDYPHQFSGGMRQRVMIAMAIACQPKLLIADEPTTALDVTIQAQILDVLRKLKEQFKMAVVFITHDLGVVAEIADRVAVMYAGRIVETAAVEMIFKNPQHPYTKALVSSIPRLHNQPVRLPVIEGAPPRLEIEESAGCSFQPRCPLRIAMCAEQRPFLTEISPAHFAACHIAQMKRSVD